MSHKLVATEIVLESMNKIKETPEPVELTDGIITVIGPSGSGKTALLKNQLKITMGKVVTGRYKDLRESHFRELRKKIETDLEIRGSTRVEDVVDNFSTMLEGVLAGNSPIGPKR